MEYRVSRVRAHHRPDQDQFWKEMVLALATASTPIELERYLTEVSPEYPGLRDPLAAREALRKQVASARRALTRARSAGHDEPTQPAVQTRVPIKASERAVFEALFDEALRPTAWTALLGAELFATSHGLEIATAIVESLGRTAPSGEPAEWLQRVQPEAVRMELADMALAPRSKVNGRILDDAIADLQRRREEADLRRMRPAGPDDDDTLGRINERLKGLKPKYE